MQKGETTKNRVKQSSLGLFHQQGYKQTSINHILDTTGIKKGTFYFHFRSKEALAVDVLKEALTRYDKKINKSVKSPSAFMRLLEMVDAITNYHVTEGISKGCIFGNMALEMGKNDTPLSDLVQTIFDQWVQRFEALIDQAVADKEMTLKETSKALARTIIAMIEGGLMLSKIHNNPNALMDLSQSIHLLLNQRKISA